MTNDAGLAAAVDALADRAPPVGSRWRHRNGAAYAVVGRCVVEATLTPAVLYASDDRPGGGLTWCRPLAEFLDGRFVRVDGGEG